MSFRYFILKNPRRPNWREGLIALNRDKEAGRLDTIAYDHLDGSWESDPYSVTTFLFGDDYDDWLTEVPRSAAEECAARIGTTLPTEQEMMRISDEAERERARER
jgi:hypothetical protein